MNAKPELIKTTCKGHWRFSEVGYSPTSAVWTMALGQRAGRPMLWNFMRSNSVWIVRPYPWPYYEEDKELALKALMSLGLAEAEFPTRREAIDVLTQALEGVQL